MFIFLGPSSPRSHPSHASATEEIGVQTSPPTPPISSETISRLGELQETIRLAREEIRHKDNEIKRLRSVIQEQVLHMVSHG